MIACFTLLSQNYNVPIFYWVLTSEEKWVPYETPKHARYWLSPWDPMPHTTRPSLHPHKIMLCIWWTSWQVVHYEPLQTGQTHTADLYSQQLEHVQEASMQKEPALVNRKGVLSLHDNARSHVAQVVRDTIWWLGWLTLCHPPYSLDFASTDYYYFHSLWEILHKLGRHSQTSLHPKHLISIARTLHSWTHVDKKFCMLMEVTFTTNGIANLLYTFFF